MIEFEGREYHEIKEFDCQVISLKYKEGGSYFTVIPISALEYRKNEMAGEQKASVSVEYGDKKTTFIITDDWGTPYTVKIDNCHSDEIASAVESAIYNELLNHHQKETP